MKRRNYTKLLKLYQLALKATGEKKHEYIKSVKYFLVTFIAQGLVFGMFYPLMKAVFADHIDMQRILILLTVMGVLSIVSLFTKWKGHSFDFSGNIIDIGHELRTRLGDSLREMPLELISTYKTGELNAIFSSNVEEAVVMMGMLTAMVVELVVVPVTIIVFTFFIEWKLAIFMVIVFPLAIPLYHQIRNINISEKDAVSKSNAQLEAGFIEYIQGLQVLRSVNRVGSNQENLQRVINEVRETQKSSLLKTQLPYILIGLLIQGALLLILFFGAYFVLDSTVEYITLAACLLIVARLVEPMSLFVSVINLFEITDVALKNINTVLNSEPLKVHQPFQNSSKHDISFEHVDFTYLGQKKRVIHDVSFKVPEKTMTAIVGHSGCGKTTLTKLLMRYADVENGAVKIGDVDIKHMDQVSLMSKFSMVFQDVYLFDDTVMNNIRMDNPSASDEEVNHAVKSAHCHEFIERLPEGFDTTIGDIGGSLSGGERQRISIARAILKDAPIVILDEPTAALDTESEVSVQQAIDELVDNRTVIVIAHRLSTIVGADQIIVMDDGEIVEQGRHHELMALKGKYYGMWAAQQRVKAWSVNDDLDTEKILVN